jgi:hypothetical protein
MESQMAESGIMLHAWHRVDLSLDGNSRNKSRVTDISRARLVFSVQTCDSNLPDMTMVVTDKKKGTEIRSDLALRHVRK